MDIITKRRRQQQQRVSDEQTIMQIIESTPSNDDRSVTLSNIKQKMLMQGVYSPENYILAKQLFTDYELKEIV